MDDKILGKSWTELSSLEMVFASSSWCRVGYSVASDLGKIKVCILATYGDRSGVKNRPSQTGSEDKCCLKIIVKTERMDVI